MVTDSEERDYSMSRLPRCCSAAKDSHSQPVMMTMEYRPRGIES